MRSAPGRIVEWTLPDGATQRGVALHDEQTKMWVLAGKVFVRLMDSEGADLMREGKRVIALKKAANVRHVGFVD